MRYKKRLFTTRNIIISILVLAITGYSIFVVSPAVSTTKDYNIAVKEYNDVVYQYNNAALYSATYNIEGMPDYLRSLPEAAPSFSAVLSSCLKGNNKSKIESDISTLRSLTEGLEEAVSVAQQITAPKESWIIDRLKRVDSILKCDTVSKTNDPNGMLGQTGGYYSCIYFSTSYFDPSSVDGKDLIAKGTDGGGAVEVYATKDDAEARSDYLAGFDNTLLYTGSYAVVGTMVIRTSYKLETPTQYELTDKIIKAFTSLD